MPAAKIDERDWQLESTDILSSIGFEPVSIEQMQLVQQAWRGVHLPQFRHGESAQLVQLRDLSALRRVSGYQL